MKVLILTYLSFFLSNLNHSANQSVLGLGARVLIDGSQVPGAVTEEITKISKDSDNAPPYPYGFN